MEIILKEIHKINSILLKQSGNQFDLGTVPQVFNNTEKDWGIGDVARNLDLNELSTFNALFQTQEVVQIISNLMRIHERNPELRIIDIIDIFLTKKILFIGSECEKMGKINIDMEYLELQSILTNKYLTIHRVENPDIDGFIDEWTRVRPEIVFISCHGSEFGLFLKDSKIKDECREILNQEFYNFFKRRSLYTECVVLSACESIRLGEMIKDEGMNVVCINSKVDISVASIYTNYFFKYLNEHSINNPNVYEEAHYSSLEKIQMNGLEDSFCFQFLKTNKII